MRGYLISIAYCLFSFSIKTVTVVFNEQHKDGKLTEQIVINLSIKLFACWVIFHTANFSKLTFSKNSFRNTIQVSNGLDTD